MEELQDAWRYTVQSVVGRESVMSARDPGVYWKAYSIVTRRPAASSCQQLRSRLKGAQGRSIQCDVQPVLLSAFPSDGIAHLLGARRDESERDLGLEHTVKDWC